MWVTWREAMRSALYAPGGFYARGEPPARHFRTSVHVSTRFAEAVLVLVRAVDRALGRPDRVDVVDMGAGEGALLRQVLHAADRDPALAGRVAATAVEVAPRPGGLDSRVRWRSAPPARIRGLVVANEWLDNIPVDAVELTQRGPRLMLVDPRTGAERTGPPPVSADLAWLREWWPLRTPGERAEIGRPRCQAWAGVVGRIERGMAVAIDYGHEKRSRPALGTMAAYQAGRAVRVIPDGSRDVTAHVAMDACARAGRGAGASATVLTSQREALRALGVTGQRPAARMADCDPLRYLRSLETACQDLELIDPDGLGGFRWVAQTVGIGLPEPLAALAAPRRPSRAASWDR